MKCSDLKTRLLKKANKSFCRAKVAAIGIDRLGRVIGCTNNIPHINRKGGGKHAEMRLMLSMPRSLSRIYIARVSNGGNPRPISPCANCLAEATRRGIVITSLT
jgi:hypothetical protein